MARAYEQEIGVPTPLNWPITHAHRHAPVLPRQGGWPVVLYAPGLGDERNDTTAIAEDLVSHGYVVVTIDFVHDSGVVELPDGRLAESAVPEPTLQVTIKEVVSRAEDVSFILDQLAVINRGGNPGRAQRPLPRGLRGSLDLDRMGMFGHSDGGSTAAHVMHVDSRVKAGVDMDGTLWTPQAVAGSDGALLLFGEQTLAADEASSWDHRHHRRAARGDRGAHLHQGMVRHVPGPPRQSPARGTVTALSRGPVRALAPCGRVGFAVCGGMLGGVECGLVGGVFPEADADRLVPPAPFGMHEG